MVVVTTTYGSELNERYSLAGDRRMRCNSIAHHGLDGSSGGTARSACKGRLEREMEGLVSVYTRYWVRCQHGSPTVTGELCQW